MLTTGHLGLKKPEGTDVVNIDDINSNMDKIDTEVVKKASASTDGRMSKEDKAKLDSVASGANKYVHPSTHGASMILQDSSHRFISDSEKNKLGGIQSGAQRNRSISDSVNSTSSTTAASSKAVKVINDKVEQVNTSMADIANKVRNDNRENVFIGKHTGENNTSGSGNTANGAGSFASNTIGSYNTLNGVNSLYANKTGSYNTANGFSALAYRQDGSHQTNLSNCSGLGFNARVSASNQVQLGNSQTTTYCYGSVQNRSDERDKTDIQETKLGLDFILALRPVEYRWDYRDDYFKEVEKEDGTKELKKIPKDGSKKRSRFHQGFIAQEVKTIIDNTGIDFAGYQDHSIKGGCDFLSLGYTEFIAPMVKAIQEQQKIIETLQGKINTLKSKVSAS
jgi:hypothetical protein